MLKHLAGRRGRRSHACAEGELFTLGDWAPKLDPPENKDALVVKAEVPTIEPKDIQLSINDGFLTIKGGLTDQYVFEIVQNGGSAVGKSALMPPWGGARKNEDVENVIASIRTLSR